MVGLCGCCGAGSHLVVGHHNPECSGQDVAVDKTGLPRVTWLIGGGGRWTGGRSPFWASALAAAI